MKPTETSQAPASHAPDDQRRREALKQFARYAAAVPTAMVLLGPRAGQAHHKSWHNPPNPGGASGRPGGYEG